MRTHTQLKRRVRTHSHAPASACYLRARSRTRRVTGFVDCSAVLRLSRHERLRTCISRSLRCRPFPRSTQPPRRSLTCASTCAMRSPPISRRHTRACTRARTSCTMTGPRLLLFSRCTTARAEMRARARGEGGAKVMVVTSLGVFYQYQLDPIKGGECRLLRVWHPPPPPHTHTHTHTRTPPPLPSPPHHRHGAPPPPRR